MEKSKYMNNRIKWLDTFRGLAAIGVIMCHWACVFCPWLYNGKSSNILVRVFRGSPLNIVTNGDIGVQFFFVCSGLMITMFVYNGKVINVRHYTKRYFSLIKIVVPSLLLSFLLMKFNFMYHIEALSLDNTLIYVNEYNNFEPTIYGVFLDFINTFFVGSQYNGPLWTIKHQLLGSIFITMLASHIFSNTKKPLERKIMYILACIPFLYIDYYLSGFVFGAFVYEMFYSFEEDNSLIGKIIRFVFDNGFLEKMYLGISIYIACINVKGFSGMYKWLSNPIFERFNPVIRAAGVAMIFLFILLNNRVQEKLESKILSYFSKISSYLYVFHWPILLSVGCCLFVKLYNKTSYMLLSSIILIATLFVTILVSDLFHRLSKIKIRK